ncbi:MAG: hypothetical protein ACPG4U_11395 [Pseudomonadales bacterium]
MIKRPSKSDIRTSLNAEIQAFIDKGGEVRVFDQGESALVNGKYDRNQFVYGYPKQERTPLDTAMNAIDNRKASSTSKAKAQPKLRRRKKVIYDDFGEPLREVWVEE